nr:MAG TPA: hypothetical protein [Caudoviricetes sp.]
MPLLRAAAAFPCEMGQAKTNPVARLNAFGDRASANRPPLISLPLEGSKFKWKISPLSGIYISDDLVAGIIQDFPVFYARRGFFHFGKQVCQAETSGGTHTEFAVMYFRYQSVADFKIQLFQHVGRQSDGRRISPFLDTQHNLTFIVSTK